VTTLFVFSPLPHMPKAQSAARHCAVILNCSLVSNSALLFCN
jgi:hypothetical protein